MICDYGCLIRVLIALACHILRQVRFLPTKIETVPRNRYITYKLPNICSPGSAHWQTVVKECEEALLIFYQRIETYAPEHQHFRGWVRAERLNILKSCKNSCFAQCTLEMGKTWGIRKEGVQIPLSCPLYRQPIQIPLFLAPCKVLFIQDGGLCDNRIKSTYLGYKFSA